MADNEKLVVFGSEEDAKGAIAAIEEVGGHVRHRWPGALVTVLADDTAVELEGRLPAGARIRQSLEHDASDDINQPESLLELALRHRQ